MTVPGFSFKQFRISQDQCAMKVTTDSCMLGALAFHISPQYILDIGAGTGILSLMMAQRFPGSWITAVETEKSACDQCIENFRNSPWSNRIRLIKARIQDLKKVEEIITPDRNPPWDSSNEPKSEQRYSPGFDLIISNPPYYEKHLYSPSDIKNLARHDISLNIQDLAMAVNWFLTNTGTFYVIFPPFIFPECKNELAQFGIYLHDLIIIFNKPLSKAIRHIGGFSRSKKDLDTNEIYIKDMDGHYTNQYKRLLRDFYLEF